MLPEAPKGTIEHYFILEEERPVKRAKDTVRYVLRGVLNVIQRLWGRRNDRSVETPRRVLLLNAAHSGDIVISTGLIPVLKSAFPGIEIGFAVGTWSADVLVGHPDVMNIHRIDHWRTNRSRANWPMKWLRYRRTRAQALREIRSLGYDWAICLHPHLPDLLSVAWQAAIPIRAAFSQVPFASLATHVVLYPGTNALITEGACQAELLRALGVEERHLRSRRSTLPADQTEALDEVKVVFGRIRDDALPAYSIVHMGAGSPGREISLAFWRELVLSLAEHGLVLLTGRGKSEWRRAEELTRCLPNIQNACDRLSWSGLVAAVRNAEQVFSVNTSIAHVAAAVRTPCQVVCPGIVPVPRWRPDSDQALVWTNHVDCAPCFRPLGCGNMRCLKGFRPADLLAASFGRKAGLGKPLRPDDEQNLR